ncbi:CheB methylesterase domain-containing protein [Lentibacillus sp. N15]|uniref:CheB methylesterase domain-containing protein n=1 Tax=Lentibacillus songyuanensis TaxID=3136161 RepID=UPI0031BA8A58
MKSIRAKTFVAVGTSTGGPRALEKMLTDLPPNFQASLLIVQHMPAGFTKSLAERLNRLTRLHVKEAVHGEVIHPSTAYIAPGNFHMKIQRAGAGYVIELTKEKERNGHRPAVDVLFESLAVLDNVNKIAVILTGMGHDGSQGIIQLKTKDVNTIVIAEAEASAIVYGMPKAALGTNFVDHIRHLHKIGETINGLVNSSRGM